MTNLIVFLDLSDMDRTLLRQVSYMDRILNLGSICLVHYIELLEMTDDLRTHFPNLERPIEEILEEELHEQAAAGGLAKDRYSVKIFSEGHKEGMIDWVNASDYHICMMGKKIVYRGTGVFSGRVARLLDKSVLFTTESTRLDLETVLIPVDFSRYSARALDLAARLTEEAERKLIAFHTFKLPMVYFPFIGTMSEDVQQSRRNKLCQRLREQCRQTIPGVAIEQEVVFAGEKTYSDAIYDYARSHYVDLVIMGIKGRAEDDSLLIGSVAERMIQSEKDLAVLLVR